jgi:hypothetical protein
MTLDTPFLSFFTPTYRRPQRLAQCMESVWRQSVACEQVIVHDTIGVGIAGVYARVAAYAASLHGEYVHVLADDDVLAGPTVVEQVLHAAAAAGHPDVFVVHAIKNGLHLPLMSDGPPVEGAIDLGCIITRRDVWQAHADHYGRRYEGDFDHVTAMWQAGRRFVYTDILFEIGPAMHGAPE